ncbi:MAG: Holliday junction branch migration protein RuvA [Gracilibacteraceae bacterium]|jgi:Holliday junction DNA helicase RuvA|nr:Holliday junction branch migration protein RuvA [Gracilibacteraceae bacterium]
MIGFLRGRVESVAAEQVVISVGGVGFEVAVPTRLAAGLSVGTETVLHTVMLVREDDISLCGLGTAEDKALFRLLISVSGVGPKVAMAVLSAFSGAEVKNAIAAEDAPLLTRAPGIGTKTAQRLILELKGKLKDEDFTGGSGILAPAGGGGDEAMDSLLALGFARPEARQALNQVRGEDAALGAGEQIRRALRLLARE